MDSQGANVPTPFPRHRGYPYLPNFWAYYTHVLELYHRFAISSDAGVGHLNRILSLNGLRILDVAAGTGRSAFAMADFADSVVGVEPDEAMLAHSRELKESFSVRNVEFRDGSAWALPGSLGTFDLVTSFHGPPFFRHADTEQDRRELKALVVSLETVLAPGLGMAFVTATPGWTHPYAAAHPSSDNQAHVERQKRAESALVREGFEFSDELLEFSYATLEEALATYGFISGPSAIDWLLERRSPTVYFGNRVYLRST